MVSSNTLSIETSGHRFKPQTHSFNYPFGFFPKCACTLSHFSHVLLFVTLLTVVCQDSLSIGFPRQEYWSGLPFPSPGDFSDLVIKPRSPTLQADALPSEPPGKPIPVWRTTYLMNCLDNCILVIILEAIINISNNV